MKASITRPDGTRIEAEGTPEEIAKFAGVSTNAPQYVFIQPQPCARPHVGDFRPWPIQPLPWFGGTICAAGAVPNGGQVRGGTIQPGGFRPSTNAACPTLAAFVVTH